MNDFIELLKNAGVPNIIIWGVAFLFAFNKIRPITMLTSTYVEKSLQTKEKQFYAKVIRNIGYWLLMYIFQIIVFYSSFYFPVVYYETLGLILFFMTISGLISAGLIYWNKDKFRRFWKKISIKTRSMILILLAIFILSIVFIFPFIIGSTAAHNLEGVSNDNGYTAITAILVVLLLLSILSLFLFKWQIKSIDLALFNPKILFVIDQTIRWYIFYPIDDKYFLCGNQPNHEESTVFRYFDRTELLQKELHILSNIDEAEISVEYII